MTPILLLPFGADRAADPAAGGDPVAVEAPPAAPVHLPVEGYVLEPIGGASGVLVGGASVVGGDGATSAFSARGRYRRDELAFAVSVPFATWRTASTAPGEGREVGLGNLAASVFLSPTDTSAVGVVAHVPLGGRAWTWVNEVEELWPAAGLDVVYRGDREVSGVRLLARLAGGVHFTGGYDPVPGAFMKLSAAGGVDVPLPEGFGLTAEGSVAWWDTSPVDASALARWEPIDGLRLRGGLLVPLASWVGAQPAPVPAGLREATLRFDVASQW